MISIKKQLITLALVAGIVSPVCAMDANQESNGWFGWKTGIGVTSLVCAGVAYYVWNSWSTKPKARPNAGKAPIYFAQPTEADIAEHKKRQAELVAQEALKVTEQPVVAVVNVQQELDLGLTDEELEAVLVAKQEEAARFNRLPITTQKTEIAALLDAYMVKPSVALEDTLRDYAGLYCQRVQSYVLAKAIEKLFSAKAVDREAACIAIKQTLGLIYPRV